MAAMTPTSAESRAEPTLTKKQCKALERRCASSSVPWNKPSLSEFQRLQIKDFEDSSHSCPNRSGLPGTKANLKSMQTLTECLQLLQELAEEVNNISQVKRGSKKAAPEGSTKEPGSLETSRRLILQWDKELQLNMNKKKTKPTDEKTRRDGPGKKDRTEVERHNEKLQQWAVELRNITEANSVSDEELKKLLHARGPKEARIAAILPLLEFVAWSLLSEDNEEDVSKLWLPTKQKAWRTGSGSPRYIPNSVWQWIQNASVSVQLDVSTSSSWLAVSSDRLRVQRAAVCSAGLSNSQSLAEWPCVLGDTVLTAGRHYWEVEVSPKGTWRIGVMSESAPRKQRPTMSPGRGYWTLWKGSSGLWACTEEPTKLQRAAVPRLIGVYVDVGEGQVSFYDVDRRVHIYTFSDTFRHSLLPLFSYLDGDTVLKIIPAQMSVTADHKNM